MRRTVFRDKKVPRFRADTNYNKDMETSVMRHPAVLIKAAVFLIWLMLIALLLKRDVFISTINLRETAAIEQAEREDYQGIYFQAPLGF